MSSTLSNKRWRLGAIALTLLLPLAACREIVGGRTEPADDQPRLLWRVPMVEGGITFHIPAADENRFYIMGDTALYALDARTGQIVWSARPHFVHMVANLVLRHGRIYGAGLNVLAIDKATGRTVWSFTPDTTATFGFSAVDEEALYFGTAGHHVYALRLSDGELLWKTDIGPDWQYSGIVQGVSVNGDTVYAAVEQYRAWNGYISVGWVFALDRTTGRVLWSYHNGAGEDTRAFDAPPRVAGRLLLVEDVWQNQFIALDRFTGDEVWRVSGLRGYFGPDEPPKVRGDTVYITSGDRYVYALDLATGRELWKTQVANSSSYLAVCGPYLLVNYLRIGVLDRATGRWLGQLHFDASDLTETGFAVTQGVAVVGGRTAIYGLRCPSG